MAAGNKTSATDSNGDSFKSESDVC